MNGLIKRWLLLFSYFMHASREVYDSFHQVPPTDKHTTLLKQLNREQKGHICHICQWVTERPVFLVLLSSTVG